MAPPGLTSDRIAVVLSLWAPVARRIVPRLLIGHALRAYLSRLPVEKSGCSALPRSIAIVIESRLSITIHCSGWSTTRTCAARRRRATAPPSFRRPRDRFWLLQSLKDPIVASVLGIQLVPRCKIVSLGVVLTLVSHRRYVVVAQILQIGAR